MTVEVSYFSLASLGALALFLGIMIPRALLHLARVVVSGRREGADPWLLAIAGAILLCAALGAGMAFYDTRAHSMIDKSEAIVLAFLLFAVPAVLQVLRAWRGSHAREVKALSHALVLLAVLSLPASMAIPTAALLQAATPPAATPPDNPAAAFADERFFTDNEVANDPEDYPVATWLAQNLTWRRQTTLHHGSFGYGFYREIPTFTAFWFDQTATVLTFDATDTFGVIVARITHVRANWSISLMVFLYKLLCAVVLVAVSFDTLLAPLALSLARAVRGKPPRALHTFARSGPLLLEPEASPPAEAVDPAPEPEPAA